MKKIVLMSLILVGCNSGNNMDLTYGQRVRMTGGFYKGCTGKVVGFGSVGTQQTFDIDLDKSCDNKQIYTYGTELVKKIK